MRYQPLTMEQLLARTTEIFPELRPAGEGTGECDPPCAMGGLEIAYGRLRRSGVRLLFIPNVRFSAFPSADSAAHFLVWLLRHYGVRVHYKKMHALASEVIRINDSERDPSAAREMLNRRLLALVEPPVPRSLHERPRRKPARALELVSV